MNNISVTTQKQTNKMEHSFEILIHKIYKFLSFNDKKYIKRLIMDAKTKSNANTMNKISSIILSNLVKKNIKRNEYRQEFIIDKIINAIKMLTTNPNIVIADIGGGNGDVLSGIKSAFDIVLSKEKDDFVLSKDDFVLSKDNFICVETKTNWVETYPFDNTNITYEFWNETEATNIKDESCDLVLCMCSLHHMMDNTLYNVIGEIKRILKKDGLLFIKEHDTQSIHDTNIINWEHHLYHIMDCAYNGNLINVDEYTKNSIHNFKSRNYYQELFKMNGFTLKYETNRFLDLDLDLENVKNIDEKNITKLYWDIFVNDKQN